MNVGKFIVFEGGEGSGKTQHMARSAAYLSERGLDVVTTHEPGSTQLGKNIRELLLQRSGESATGPAIVPVAELFLFLADRAQHVSEVIKPALTAGSVVLCDRFSGSTLAYQIGGRKINEATVSITDVEALSHQDVQPDHVIYLDVDPRIGIQRKTTQQEHEVNRFETTDITFHDDIRNYFQHLAEQNSNWTQIDANRSLDEVQLDVNELLNRLFKESS